MKTHALIISAIVLTAFAGLSLAETDTSIHKPAAAQSLAGGIAQKAAPDAAKGVKVADEAAVKAKEEAQDAAKQPLQDIAGTEDKAKAAEEGASKARHASKETEKTAKVTQHSAEKAVEKAK